MFRGSDFTCGWPAVGLPWVCTTRFRVPVVISCGGSDPFSVFPWRDGIPGYFLRVRPWVYMLGV